MQVICLEDQAFRALIDEVVSRIKEQNNLNYDKWVSGDEAMNSGLPAKLLYKN